MSGRPILHRYDFCVRLNILLLLLFLLLSPQPARRAACRSLRAASDWTRPRPAARRPVRPGPTRCRGQAHALLSAQVVLPTLPSVLSCRDQLPSLTLQAATVRRERLRPARSPVRPGLTRPPGPRPARRVPWVSTALPASRPVCVHLPEPTRPTAFHYPIAPPDPFQMLVRVVAPL